MKPAPIAQGATISLERLRRSQSEAAFQRSVCNLAVRAGWTVMELPRYVLRCELGHKVHWGRSVAAGWPDLVLLRPPRMIAWECKSATGKATPEQLAMLERLAACGYETAVIRPDDLDAIEEVLR